MIAGEILLTNFVLNVGQVDITDGDGVEHDMIALIAGLKVGDNQHATVTIPMTVEGITNVFVQLANVLSPTDRAVLMAKLSVKGVAIAGEGDVKRVADSLRHGGLRSV